MSVSLSRRDFHCGALAAAFAGLAAGPAAAGVGDDAALVPDPRGLVDLLPGFSYRIISALGDPMDDGEPVPDHADGMGLFPRRDGRLILVRNHELRAGPGTLKGRGFDRFRDGSTLPGGTTTLVYDPRSARVERQYRSLAGTIYNCSGGTTPWRTWLSCEEDVTEAGANVGRNHGWVFEVPADLVGRARPVPLKRLGRFKHEAAAVDPRSGIVYLTEDERDSLFYRFVASKAGRLDRPGRLQALALIDGPDDSRNWSEAAMPRGRRFRVRWIDLDRVDSPDGDLRLRGAALGACRFARGEGIHVGRGELYFTCTSGGMAGLGQIMRYTLSPAEGRADESKTPGTLELFFESRSTDELYYGDNLVLAPNGHLLVCEDQPGERVDNFLRAIRPDGTSYPFARLRLQTEWAGACFAPDGRTLFVNLYSPTRTLVVNGPFYSVIAA